MKKITKANKGTKAKKETQKNPILILQNNHFLKHAPKDATRL